MIQPFKFQYCTAFRERQQLADKLNQIINRLNDVDFDTLAYELEEINTRMDGLENGIEEINKELHPEWELAHGFVYDEEEEYAFTKDVKIVFDIPYHYKYPNDDTLYDDEYRGEIYIKKGTKWPTTQRIIPSDVSTSYYGSPTFHIPMVSITSFGLGPLEINRFAIGFPPYKSIRVYAMRIVDNVPEFYVEDVGVKPPDEVGHLKIYTKVES